MIYEQNSHHVSAAAAAAIKYNTKALVCDMAMDTYSFGTVEMFSFCKLKRIFVIRNSSSKGSFYTLPAPPKLNYKTQYQIVDGQRLF